ncbi:TIGR03435 family protein [Rubrivirga sp.]|uniref:TIGR03435 family protein n=1 Tax=Rubrivirga sp. TaxID=1885344 RepID=UPI003C716316
MRLVLAVLATATLATAQTDSLSARDAISQQIAEARAALPGPDAPPTFEAAWSDREVGPGVSVSSNFDDGTFRATGAPLRTALVLGWTAHFPHHRNPMTSSIWSSLIDAPDELIGQGVDALMVRRGLTRETFGNALLDGLTDALGLEVTFQARPHVVYALRVRDASLLPSSGGEDWSGRAMGRSFRVRGATSLDLASMLGGSLGHVVVDETGLDGRYTFDLEFDGGALEVVDFDRPTMSAGEVDVVRAALSERVGLELVPEVRAVEWMVVRLADEE